MNQSAKKLIHLNTSHDYKKKQEAIQQAIDLLPPEPGVRQFAEIFLDFMSVRRIQTYSPKDLAQFVLDRYEFTRQALTEGGAYRLELVDKGKYLVEVSYPYLSHLLMTIERLLLHYDAKIKFKIHPELAGCIDTETKTVSFSKPATSSSRLSIIYFEFHSSNLTISIDDLRQEIAKHIIAVRAAHSDKAKIKRRLEELHNQIREMNFQIHEPKEEWLALFKWLLDHNFSFLGYAALPTGNDSSDSSKYLGILSDEVIRHNGTELLEVINAHSWKLGSKAPDFVFDSLRLSSPVQRRDNLMRLSLIVPTGDGEKTVNHTFIGLLNRSSVLMRNYSTPLIRLKMKEIFDAKGFIGGSYNHSEVARIFSTLPKFELFRSSTGLLLKLIDDLLSITDPNEIHCYAQRDQLYNRMLIVIFVPKQMYNQQVKGKIVEHIRKMAPAVDEETFEIDDRDSHRLHLYFDLANHSTWEPDLALMEVEIGEILKSWETKVLDLVETSSEYDIDKTQCRTMLSQIPDHYRSRTSPEETVRDLYYLEKLNKSNKSIQFDLLPFEMSGSYLDGKASLLYVYSRDKIDLIHIMPTLGNMGIYVLDQLTTRVGDYENTVGYIQSFRVRNFYGECIDIKKHKLKLGEMLTAIFDGRIADDPLNSLVLIADLHWKVVSILKLYRNLLLQLKNKYGRNTINNALQKYPHIAAQLTDYFYTKFSVDQKFGEPEYRSSQLLPSLRKKFIENLREVSEVSYDYIFRRIFDLMEKTLRTNFFIPKENGETFISVKIDSKRIAECPVPTPYVEIYVHDVDLEGTHLRFGPVARGGLRWSDRPEDFRTEVLGLVKTQQTKNVVIVPEGSKGGFCVSNLPQDRKSAQEKVEAEYRKFISALLDITDNLDQKGDAQHPPYVIPYDKLDPYLVVAADKGTATFSDIANGISAKYKFWLGDAFASGGSYGYDHKKVGITARGGWECVKLHFREIGRDIQTEPTTVIGVGDMSGDVFGNGLLQSKSLLLQAAFNHMHIFLDPTPDPATSWQERKRLFDLPRSTWQDYDRSLVSAGGGVFDRKAKEIHLSPEARQMLNIQEKVLNGEQLIKAILKMKADLLWFGGIGTYIRTPEESDLAVGDQANDPIRITTDEVQVRVIAEGANLGMTQLARRRVNRQGVSLNTDAIDNSGGVNMSDYEVNIKILLRRLMNEKKIANIDERNEILEKATEEVSELVLANNRAQHRMISMDHIRSTTNFRAYCDLIKELILHHGLNPKSEFIPTIAELDLLNEEHEPLSRPVLAVVQAYAKMWIFRELMASKVVDHPSLDFIYVKYFPKSIRERFNDDIKDHQLKREIIATQLTNRIVNQAGCNFVFHTSSITKKSISEVVEAYMLIDVGLGTGALRKILLYTNDLAEDDKYHTLIQIEEHIGEIVKFLLNLEKPVTLDRLADFKRFFTELSYAAYTSETISRETSLSFSEESLEKLAVTAVLEIVPDILLLADANAIPVAEALDIVQIIHKRFELHFLERMIHTLDTPDSWTLAFKDNLIDRFGKYRKEMMRVILDEINRRKSEELPVIHIIDELVETKQNALDAYLHIIYELQQSSSITPINLSVAIDKMNFLGKF
ncbi:MAG: NAD-glutamate dehydrogenase [Bdellovibrionales bacterium]|nr:NAD-glutamate dehydrogenase [Bdellovibrionales bacterium]